MWGPEVGMAQPPIRFRFDERKATAAAALLMQLAGRRISVMRLLKLLYLAERQSLVVSCVPVSNAHPGRICIRISPSLHLYSSQGGETTILSVIFSCMPGKLT